jgi:hypothetical protein
MVLFFLKEDKEDVNKSVAKEFKFAMVRIDT